MVLQTLENLKLREANVSHEKTFFDKLNADYKKIQINNFSVA